MIRMQKKKFGLKVRSVDQMKSDVEYYFQNPPDYSLSKMNCEYMITLVRFGRCFSQQVSLIIILIINLIINPVF